MILFFHDLFYIVICIVSSDTNSYEQSAVVEINVNAITVLQQIENCATECVFIDVEYIYGFVWWGVCKQSRWRHSVTEPSQAGGYVLLWQRYDNNKMVAMRYYSTSSTVQSWTELVFFFLIFVLVCYAPYVLVKVLNL